MRTSLKILGGILLVLIILIIALNLYFTDDRLKQMAMPYVNEATGREVQVESFSLTFFRTFPHPGLSISGMTIPDEAPDDTLASLRELVVGVKLFPLLRNKIDITEMKLNNPRFTYVIYEDGTTNLDFLLDEATDDTTEEAGYAVAIPRFTITGARFGYDDRAENSTVRLHNLNALISLTYADLIESDMEIDIGGLDATINGSRVVRGLPLSLTEKSIIDTRNETISLEEGTFSIRGLNLDLSGTITGWSNEVTDLDLRFTSSSDDFGELLHLAPEEYQSQIRELNTRGSLTIDGTLNGAMGGEELPRFDLTVSVQNGYIKNPDLPQPVENITLSARASNDLLTVDQLRATAGSNELTASGRLQQPLQENGRFNLKAKGNIDLSTVNQFYSLQSYQIDEMRGRLNFDGSAEGNRNDTGTIDYNADIDLRDAAIKYRGVPEPIEGINVVAAAGQNRIKIDRFTVTAGNNSFSLNGTVTHPLEEDRRTMDLGTNLNFDLGSLKNFYPIDEDSLALRGRLITELVLKGKATQIEQAVQKGRISLADGYIDYKKWKQPVQDITLESTMQGNRLNLSRFHFRSGDNNLTISGNATDYLGENPMLDMMFEGKAQFSQIHNYYDLEPSIRKMTGSAAMDLRVRGPLQRPEEMAFDGNLTIRNFSMEGDSLAQPVHNLSGELNLTPTTATLKSLAFKLGTSDLNLNGELKNYMAYLKSEDNRTATPGLTGTFRSKFFNLDELIDWTDTTETQPTPIELPDLNSSVSARIDTLIATGVRMKNMRADVGTTPKQISLKNGYVEMFDGTMTGAFTWDVPRPDQTMISYKGAIDSMRIGAFFREYEVLGEASNIHTFLTGDFNARTDYYSVLDVYLEPLINTTRMEGSFGMSKARMKGHPMQNRLARMFNNDDFRNIVLDRWNSTYSVENSVLTFKDLTLTSGEVGVDLSGTRHLVTDDIDYKMQVILPGKFKDDIAKIISKQGAEALTRENGTIMVPLRVTGKAGDPDVGVDQEVVKRIIREFLKNKGTKLLKNLFDKDGKN